MEQLALSTVDPTRFKLFVYRRTAGGVEVLFLRVAHAWALPEGVCRLAEPPARAAERCLRETLGLDLAALEGDRGVSDELLFLAEADDGGDQLLDVRRIQHRWLGLGKIRALRLDGDPYSVERLAVCFE